MKLTAKTDLEVPGGFVYASLLDHDAWERVALARGIGIERPADMPLAGPGAGWRVRVPFRGKPRDILLRLDEATPETKVAMGVHGEAIEGSMVLEVLALSPRRTRLRLVLEIKPRTLAARLVLNTLRLARGRVQARLDLRIGQVGRRIEGWFAERRASAGRG